MREIFESLTIVELASVLAGPSVGTFFSELGAKVIKIENKKTGGDVTRQWKLNLEDQDSISAYYSSVNYGKQILFKDLKNAHDKASVLELISQCDIVISNFKAGSDLKLGMDYDTLKKINPKLIYGNITGFEKDQSTAAYDMVMQAETGFLSMTGNESDLAKIPVALSDIIAAHQLKEGILTALLTRNLKGGSYHVSCSLEKAALSALVNQGSNYLMTGSIAQPMGTLHPNIAPYGEVLESADRKKFIFAIGSDRQFSKAALMLNIEVGDKFASNELRLKNRSELYNVMKAAAALFNLDHIKSYCVENKIPFGEIKSLDQVLDSVTAREMILEETIEGTETKRLSSIAFNISS